MIMPIEYLADWDQRLARQDAFWHKEVLGRPVVHITLPKEKPEYPWPRLRKHPSQHERWMDSEYMAEYSLACVMNTDYLGDALPTAWPNLGPEVFSAFLGCELEFGEITSWSIPSLSHWSEVGKISFSQDNVYWKKINEMTDALLEIGKGKFYTGFTDLHPGGDAIVAFRDPQQLNIDMIENPEEIRKLLEYVTRMYFSIFDFYSDKLASSGQALSNWSGIVSSRKWYVPSNDFSCMISKRMFDEMFLPWIVEECKHLETSMYHLDGPNALRHLDSLLSIEELNAIQWVYGAGNGRASDWMDVYKKCQAAGKCLQISLEVDEIDLFMNTLRPEGLWISLTGITERGEAEAAIGKIEKWV